MRKRRILDALVITLAVAFVAAFIREEVLQRRDEARNRPTCDDDVPATPA